MRCFSQTLSSTAVVFLLCSTAAFADGDAAKGKQLFNRCSACHAIDGQNRSGPPLNGIIGKPAALAPGYNYSPALVGANIIWTDEALETYLAGPARMVRGTRMSISITRPQDRADIISYLKTLTPQ